MPDRFRWAPQRLIDQRLIDWTDRAPLSQPLGGIPSAAGGRPRGRRGLAHGRGIYNGGAAPSAPAPYLACAVALLTAEGS